MQNKRFEGLIELSEYSVHQTAQRVTRDPRHVSRTSHHATLTPILPSSCRAWGDNIDCRPFRLTQLELGARRMCAVIAAFARMADQSPPVRSDDRELAATWRNQAKSTGKRNRKCRQEFRRGSGSMRCIRIEMVTPGVRRRQPTPAPDWRPGKRKVIRSGSRFCRAAAPAIEPKPAAGAAALQKLDSFETSSGFLGL